MLLPSALSTAIISILSSQSLSIHELHIKLKSRQITISLPTLYRHIQELLEKIILYKYEGKLGLHSLWIAERELFLNHIHKNQPQSLQTMKQGDRIVYQAKTLYELEHQRINIILSLATEYPGHDYCRYNHHAYFTLGVGNLESQLYQAITNKKGGNYGIIGSNSPLDQLALSQQSDYRASISINTPRAQTSGFCVNVYHERVFEFILPQMAQSVFHVFFDNIKDIADFDVTGYRKLFDIPFDYQLVLYRNSQQARQIRHTIIGSIPKE